MSLQQAIFVEKIAAQRKFSNRNRENRRLQSEAIHWSHSRGALVAKHDPHANSGRTTRLLE